MPSFYEFFAGGGMARLGLGEQWECLFANDISKIKAAAYIRHFPGSESHFGTDDVRDVTPEHLPGHVDLIWGSFPCQDLSLAGTGQGLKGTRSGLVWKLLELVEALQADGRGPKVLVLENVSGFLNTGGGDDFFQVLRTLSGSGFLYGVLAMDAEKFLPQSRPRIFLVAIDTQQVRLDLRTVNGRVSKNYPWTSTRLDALMRSAPADVRKNWVWWALPEPPARVHELRHLLEEHSTVEWDSSAYTQRLIELMSPIHRHKVEAAMLRNREVVGALYRRTRLDAGIRRQRVEVRFDGLSGCLRTPSGGSSRQRLLFVDGANIRSRLLSAREAARLMGLPDSYALPTSYNDAYQLAGDGVAVPVVAWLSQNLLLPLVLPVQEPSDKLRYA